MARMRPFLTVITTVESSDRDALLRDLVHQVNDLILPCLPGDSTTHVTVVRTPQGTYVAEVENGHGTTAIPLAVASIQVLAHQAPPPNEARPERLTDEEKGVARVALAKEGQPITALTIPGTDTKPARSYSEDQVRDIVRRYRRSMGLIYPPRPEGHHPYA